MADWIPVTDCLPKDSLIFSEIVIVYSPDNYGREHIGQAHYFAGEFTHGDHHNRVHNVTHWMPLPAPPDEQEDQ